MTQLRDYFGPSFLWNHTDKFFTGAVVATSCSMSYSTQTGIACNAPYLVVVSLCSIYKPNFLPLHHIHNMFIAEIPIPVNQTYCSNHAKRDAKGRPLCEFQNMSYFVSSSSPSGTYNCGGEGCNGYYFATHTTTVKYTKTTTQK
ncbi:hypothetical protein A0H81_04639 [Grifola frondosa]|uniref:Uncharacterized protein n=1 Tax=Grifola frondosa TaxID=5627 RepID=A0A1C7MFT4_GRIFR|nr:hypothetical protein A0H81_04639 [Grifola frondosa]